jgi:SAM-dependent methyltransferase
MGFIGVHLADLVDAIDGLDPLPRIEVRPADPALAEYVRTIRARVNYVQSKAESIPASDGSYNLVACINVVDHAQDPERILGEIVRVLAPGGLFAFGVSTLSMVGEWKWKLNRRLDPTNWHFLAHPHTYQWRRADAMLRRLPVKVLWTQRPRTLSRLAGQGTMSFWIMRKA